MAVLFLDLTGFTGLGQVLDHEVLHDLVFSIMECFSGVVKSYGGYVDKFEGDRLMALFGATAAAENDSARAVGCALRMMDILDELRPSLPLEIGARVGIHTGQVTVAPDPAGHLTATGSTVNMASRIEEMAEPGAVSVSGAVRGECGELFSFVELGALSLRGFSEPVELFVPLGPGKAKYERWNRSSRVTGVPLVGRDEELDELFRLLEKTRREPCATCLVSIQGEAGIGKSRLLHQFLESAEGVTVLHGHGGHYSRTPFWIWTDLLRNHWGISGHDSGEIHRRILSLAAECPDEKLGEKITREADRLTELLCLTGEHSREESQNIVVAIRLALNAIGTGRTLMLVLEDIHWMDAPSARVLELFVSSGGSPSGTMVIVTGRPSSGPPEIPFQNWEVMELGALGNADTEAITGYLLASPDSPAQVSERLSELIARESRGNPFYAEELVLSLLETGGISEGPDGVWNLSIESDDIHVPPSVQSLIQSRVDILPVVERRVLQFASVIGVGFSPLILEGLLSKLAPEMDMDQAVESLLKRNYLSRESSGMLLFRNHLVQLSVYQTMLRHNRRVIHGIIAGVYESSSRGETAVIAPVIFNHWKLSGNEEKTLEWAAKALETACANEQTGEQLRIAETILSLTGPDSRGIEWETRIKALNARQSVEGMSGEPRKALETVEEILRESRARNNAAEEALAIRVKCILLSETGKHENIEELLRIALEKAAEAGDPCLTARIYSTMANHYSDTTRYEKAMEYYKKALVLFEEKDMLHFLVSTRTNLANLLTRTGRYEEAVKEFTESIKLSRKLGKRSALGYALNGLAIEKARAGDLETAGKLFEEALEYQIDIGNKGLQASIISNLGVLTRMLGDNSRSLKYRLEALKMARESDRKRSEAIALVNTASIYRHMERYADALEDALAAEELSLQINDLLSVCHALSIRGAVMLLTGRGEEAVSLYEQAADILERTGITPDHVDDFKELKEMLAERGLSAAEPD